MHEVVRVRKEFWRELENGFGISFLNFRERREDDDPVRPKMRARHVLGNEFFPVAFRKELEQIGSNHARTRKVDQIPIIDFFAAFEIEFGDFRNRKAPLSREFVKQNRSREPLFVEFARQKLVGGTEIRLREIRPYRFANCGNGHSEKNVSLAVLSFSGFEESGENRRLFRICGVPNGNLNGVHGGGF